MVEQQFDGGLVEEREEGRGFECVGGLVEGVEAGECMWHWAVGGEWVGRCGGV